MRFKNKKNKKEESISISKKRTLNYRYPSKFKKDEENTLFRFASISLLYLSTHFDAIN